MALFFCLVMRLLFCSRIFAVLGPEYRRAARTSLTITLFILGEIQTHVGPFANVDFARF